MSTIDASGITRQVTQTDQKNELLITTTCQIRPTAGFDGGPDIFAALREQLGLQIERGKRMVDFPVTEPAERSSETGYVSEGPFVRQLLNRTRRIKFCAGR